jgi:dephospho-CoA kinase
MRAGFFWLMITLGITGGIGMGKSAAEKILLKRGLPVVDTDQIARELVEPRQPALDEIRQAFGGKFLKLDGSLDRETLGRLVFSEPAARAELEKILHPRIRFEWLRRKAGLEILGHPLMAVVIPLLFETGAEADVDITVCVACSPGTQLQRLHERGWSPDQMRRRMEAQMPVETKLARARFVIWTEGTLDAHEQQWERVLHRLRGGDAVPGGNTGP